MLPRLTKIGLDIRRTKQFKFCIYLQITIFQNRSVFNLVLLVVVFYFQTTFCSANSFLRSTSDTEDESGSSLFGNDIEPSQTMNDSGLSPVLDSCSQITNACPYVNSNPDNPFKNPGNGSSLSARSLSPWVWVRNYNSLRVPQEIYEACCVCRFCLDPANRNRQLQTSGSRYYSIPIMDKKNITIKADANSPPVAKSEEFAIGCTCAKPASA